MSVEKAGGADEIGPPGAPAGKWRPRLGLGALMLGVALVAVCLKWPILAAPVVLLGGAGAVGRVWGPGPGRAAAAVLVAVYAPTIQGFFLDCEHCRGVWRWVAPVLPGGIVAELLRALTGLRMPSEASSYGLAAALTLRSLARITYPIHCLGRIE
jgi:hypothetical protein